jgi:hypothetical protein
MSDDYLDTTAPTHETLVLLGSINYAWAQLDLVSSAAFASLLKLDPAELGMTMVELRRKPKSIKCTPFPDIAETSTYQVFLPR